MAGAELSNDALVDTGEVNTDNLIVNNSAFEAARLAVEDLRLNMDRPTGIPRDPCDINFLKGIRSAHKIDILKQCDDIEQHIIERGSKSALVTLRSMLVSKLEAVTEAHIRYAAAEGLSFTAQQKAYSEFVGKLEIRARQVNLQVNNYLQARDEECVSESGDGEQQQPGDAKHQGYADLIDETRRRRRVLEQHLAHQSAAVDYGQKFETPSRRKVGFD